jgi:tetratricopeptide (TPR) repeat protein
VPGRAGLGERAKRSFPRAPDGDARLKLILDSHSVSYGKATPYLPVRDLLKGDFEIDDRDEARKIREQVTALDLARQLKERGSEALVLHQVGTVHTHAAPPDAEQAEANYQQALALAEELGMRPLQAHCHHGLGRLYGQIGRGDQARAELSAAIALYRGMEMTFWLPRAEAVLGQSRG